jgi:hypothetical protein
MTGDDLVIIAPEAVRGSGGLADYTLRLLENLPGGENLRVLVPSEHAPQVPQSAGKILVQYSAYGFDALGYPRDLIQALIDWKNKTPGRLVVMFHEIWTFWPVTNKNFFVQLFHRRAIKGLLRHIDFAFTSTSSQAEHLHALCANTPIHVLPVGSNIRRSVDVDLPRKRGWAVIFGLPGSRLRALRKIQNSLSSLAAAKVITKMISVGANFDFESKEEERRLLTSLQLADGFQQLGAQPESAISKILATVSLGVFGQDELSYAKSGTFMAYAAHALNILADFAEASKPAPICWLVAPRELLEGISPVELKTRARGLRDWQEKTSSWELIGAKFSEALELNANERAQIASR